MEPGADAYRRVLGRSNRVGLHRASDRAGSAPVPAHLRGPIADRVERALAGSKIETRRWWGNGAHAHPATSAFPRAAVPATDALARSTLGVPFYRDIGAAEIGRSPRSFWPQPSSASHVSCPDGPTRSLSPEKSRLASARNGPRSGFSSAAEAIRDRYQYFHAGRHEQIVPRIWSHRHAPRVTVRADDLLSRAKQRQMEDLDRRAAHTPWTTLK